MTPRERIARLLAAYSMAITSNDGEMLPDDIWMQRTDLADRILAAFPEIAGEMGYVKGGSVTLKNDDQLTGRGADIVRDWRPTINGDTTGD
jgi:hypothetical protein